MCVAKRHIDEAGADEEPWSRREGYDGRLVHCWFASISEFYLEINRLLRMRFYLADGDGKAAGLLPRPFENAGVRAVGRNLTNSISRSEIFRLCHGWRSRSTIRRHPPLQFGT
jgi:hypothetical protein